jgi:predicted  nucleic acid-binding Zn-ribbon protein
MKHVQCDPCRFVPSNPGLDRSIDASVAGPLTIEWLPRIHNKMSMQIKSSSGGSTPNGSTPNGFTASPSDLLEFPVLQEFTELTSKLVEAIESSRLILQRNSNEIGVLRESVRSLDLRLSGIVQQVDVSARKAQQAPSEEFAGLRESVASLNGRLSALAEQLEALTREGVQATNGEIAGLQESVASLNGRLSALAEQSVEEKQARIQVEARTASLENEFASGSQVTELDLPGLQQALVATRSQCLMLETQQQALAIKVEGLIKRADQKAAPAPSANDAESVDRDSHGTAHQPQSQSPHDQSPHDQSSDVQSNDVQSKRVSLAIAPVFPLYGAAAQIERLTPSPEPVEPSQGFAAPLRRGSALTLPLFVGGVAASALLGVGLVFVGPKLFREPEPGTPAKSVPLPQNPLPANAKTSSSLGPVAAVSKPAPPAQDKLKIDCPDVCWVEVNRVVDGNTIYASMLKGSVEFPIGKGLQVSSGRSDILMLKINDGAPFALNAREMISSRLIKSPS